MFLTVCDICHVCFYTNKLLIFTTGQKSKCLKIVIFAWLWFLPCVLRDMCGFRQYYLRNLIASILFNHASFRGFAQAYNYLHAKIDFSRIKLNAKRLTDVFYTYELNKYYSEFRKESLTRKLFLLIKNCL